MKGTSGKNGERITDSCLGIRNKLYHVECQSTPDNTMIVRMVEYDFAIALERADLTGEIAEMKMPRSCVLYLRHNSNTPDVLRMKVVFSNGQSVIYQVPVVKVQQYTKGEIFQKRLLMFLPFYIMRYEGKYKEIKERIGEIMGGHVLELESERIIREATEKGMAQGMAQGMTQGQNRILQLFKAMKADNRMEEYEDASENAELLEILFAEYGL